MSIDEKRKRRLAYKREYQKAYRASGKDAEARQRYRQTDNGKKKHNEWTKAANARTRAKVIAGYGGKCTCCGESEPVFLAVDHVNNNGNIERKTGITSIALCYKIIRENFPLDYQLLCHNCNWAKQRGECPHKARR